MDQITMLGTGHAMTFDCFNTCFLYENENGVMLTDTGGGQLLLLQLRRAHCDTGRIRDIFISHRHTDHLTGLPWLFRMVDKMPVGAFADRPLSLYLHPDLMSFVPTMLLGMFPDLLPRLLDAGAVRFVPIHDGEQMEILGRSFTFCNLYAHTPQFGYLMGLPDGRRFLFHGDVPFEEKNRERFTGTEIFMHEAFELSDHLKPKNPKQKRSDHSSVLQAGEYAESLGAKALILVHGNDRDLAHRKENYTAEAKQSFSGTVYVPYDLETITL